MARHRGPVLVNTNVILECWRTNAWRALVGGYQVETVEDCVIETQTGYQKRRAEQQIEQPALQKSLAAVHKVSDAEKAAAVVRESMFSFLDPGERRFGRMRWVERTAGYFAVLTRRAFVSAFALDSGNASWRLKTCCEMLAITHRD